MLCISRMHRAFSPFYSNLFGVLFNAYGLLAELLAILDSFFYQYHKLLHRGGWLGVVRSHEVAGKIHIKYWHLHKDPWVL